MFCDKYGALTCALGVLQDQVNWIFDQDCNSDIGSSIDYTNWFIYRVATSSITIANYNNIPDFAVNFGDKDGDLRAHALAVDEFGYIYVHGISSSPAFGG